MAVSFTHIVKAAEPVLSVILSGPLLGMSYIPLVYWSLLPIVAGCALSAMKEVSFAWNGFGNAMLSNLGFVLRNIYSKKYLDVYEKELQITGINMYAIITILSFLIEIPFAVAFEGHRWTEMWAAAAASQGGPTAMIQLVAVGGLFYHL
jgi:solute carrier family 35, member E1